MTCSHCKSREAVKSSVINAIYYPDLCGICYMDLTSGQSTSSGYADYERGRDSEEHGADIQQPYNADGTMNAQFMRLYPDSAKKMFTPDEITRTMRS